MDEQGSQTAGYFHSYDPSDPGREMSLTLPSEAAHWLPFLAFAKNCSVEEFLHEAVLRYCEETLAGIETIQLTPAESERLALALLEPPKEPTDAMKRAMEHHRAHVEMRD